MQLQLLTVAARSDDFLDRHRQSFELVERLYKEQCIAPTTDIPERIELNERPSSSSLQSPADPDVTYSGHKGKGYSVQVAETCGEENAFQAVTAVLVHGANESDQHHVAAVWTSSQCKRCPLRVECPTEKRLGRRVLWFGAPDVAVARRRAAVMHADGGYASQLSEGELEGRAGNRVGGTQVTIATDQESRRSVRIVSG